MARKPLPAERALEILAKAQIGRLGTAADGQPYVVPLTYVWYRERIYYHGNPRGRKMREIAANPKVCFQADDEAVILPRERACDFTAHYYSVQVFGTARVVTEPAVRLAALQALVAKYDPEGRTPPLASLEMAPDKVAVVEITPAQISGVDHARPRTL